MVCGALFSSGIGNSPQTRRVTQKIFINASLLKKIHTGKCYFEDRNITYVRHFIHNLPPNFSAAEHYGLRNTTCLYSKDVTSGSFGKYPAYGSKSVGVILNILPAQKKTSKEKLKLYKLL
jgi:hypothetical protein